MKVVINYKQKRLLPSIPLQYSLILSYLPLIIPQKDVTPPMFRCQCPYVRMSVPLSATTSWVCPNLSAPMFRCHFTYVRMSVSLCSDVSPPIFQPQFTNVRMSLPQGSDVTTSRFRCHSTYLTTPSFYTNNKHKKALSLSRRGPKTYYL